MASSQVTASLGAEITGFDVIETMREHTGRTLPSILVTGDTSRAVDEESGRLESCGTLNKPVDPDLLIDKIRELLA